MQANLAEKDFLAKAFSAEDKKNSNEALDAATEKFNKLDEEAIKLTRELKAGGRKLTFEDYQKIDAAWGASAAAEAKMNEIKNADKKEIAFDFAQNQYKKIQKGEQMSCVEGSFLSKFNVLTGEDTVEKFEPTVKDKMGEVAAKITDVEETSEKDKAEDKIEEVAENESKQTVEFPPAIVPGEELKNENQIELSKDKKDNVDFGGISAEKIAEMEKTGGPVLLDADNQIWMQKLPKDQLEQLQKMLEEQKNGNSKTEAIDSNSDKIEESSEKSETTESDTEDTDIESSEKENSETEKKKGIVAGVIEKIKKHSDGIKRFALIAWTGAMIALAAHGGNKINTNNNTAVEKSMDNSGDTNGNVEEALAEYDADSEVDSLIKGNSFNIMVDGNETKIELNDNINPEFPGFTDSRRSGNDMIFVDRSGLESLKEQGASSEALGAEGMKEILNTMENPNMASYLGASFGAFEMADSPTAVNDITYMIQHGDAEAQVAIKEKANNTIANFLYAENKDGENIMDMNVRDGFKENSLRALGVIEKNASDGEVMNVMSSVKILGINVKCGQVIFQYLKTEKKEATKTVDKTEVTTPVVTPENVEVVENKEPEPSKPKNETPAPTPKENPKTPENNVSEGKTNTASANEDDIKLSETVKEAGFANREGNDERNVQTNTPGGEVTDAAHFDQMVREAAKQDLTPNSFITTQDNSQGIVRQEGVATEKQTDAKNKSVLPEESRPEQSNPEGSVLKEDKVETAQDKADLMSAANADNAKAHESGQTRTVNIDTTSEQ